ncbi:protein DpdH [Blastococcus sp. SYSU DS0510]
MSADARIYAGYRCWRPDWVDETISTEAVTSSPAVFLATHRPLQIARTPVQTTDLQDRSAVRVVDEATVLKDFVQRRPVNGVLIMPVVGQSGTGKSHLVRWIREHLEERADRRVVYIEKTNTNLSGVVRALLSGLEGEQFDVIRQEVDRVVTDYDARRLPGELLTQLALSIEFATVDETKPDVRYRRGLVGPGRLSALLRDDIVYTRLLAPDGVISRLAKEIQQGRSADDPDRRFGFEVSDFPTDLHDIASAGAAAQGLMRQLAASEDLLATAVQLLNENLDQAVLRLANLTGGQLQQAMLDIRRELHGKQEIVLLVEDFAVIQGVQRDLLDAITEVSVREGRDELAPIRTLMAVTRGYYETLADTVTTRVAAGVPYLYDLDITFGEGKSEVTASHLADFAARYLNAARLGREALEQARSAKGRDPEAWVPNACEDCPFKDKCHDAFGVSTDGHGLYPFNASVLGRTVRSRSSSEVFNPRAVLGRVLRPVLENHYEELAEGKFPPESFSRDFPLNVRDRPLLPEVVTTLRRSDPVDVERRTVLLEYWGGAPGTAVNLKEGIHEAFKLPMVSSFQTALPDAHGSGDEDPDQERNDRESPVWLKRGMTALENWYGRGEVLPQDVARRLREAISQAVQGRVSWNDELMAAATKDELKQVLRDRNAFGVRIEDAAGEAGQQEPGPATVRIARNDVNAAMLRALLMRSNAGHWNFPGGPDQARHFSSLVDAWASKLVAGVRELRGADNEEVAGAAVSASLVSALVLGVDGARSREHADLLRAVFDEGEGIGSPADTELRARQWRDMAAAVVAVRPALVAGLRAVGGAAQGDGQMQLIDPDRLLPHVKAAAIEPVLEAPQEAPGWLVAALKPLGEKLEGAVDAQWQQLEEWLGVVQPAFGGPSDVPDVLAGLNRALEESSQAGLYAGGRAGPASEMLDLLTAARKYAWSTVDDIVTALEACGDDKLRRLREAAVDRGRSYAAMRDLAIRSDIWLDGSLDRAEVRLRDDVPEEGLALVVLLEELDEHIQRLAGGAS